MRINEGRPPQIIGCSHPFDETNRGYRCNEAPPRQVSTPGPFLAPYRPSDQKGKGGGARGEHEGILVVERSLSGLAFDADRGRIADAKLLILVLALRLRSPELFAPFD